MSNDHLKTLAQAEEETIQERGRDEDIRGHFLPLLSYMVRAGELIAPWWSKRRDKDMDGFWKRSDHTSGAFYTLASRLSSVKFRIEPRVPGVKAHRRLAEEYQENVESTSQWGQGWQSMIVPSLIDLWTQDNGFFLEVIGAGDKGGPLEGLALGLAHLDSFRCQRTGSAEFPVIYEDTDGMRYKLHRTRVVYASQMPSPRAEMYGVGFCWLSRAINTAQSMIDILQYKQEKLGSRPKRSIGITKGGLDPEDVAAAFAQADPMMDAQGLSRFSKMVLVGDQTLPDADLSLIDLASLPDGFDEETSITLGMFTLALTGAVPPRWLWPATTTGATKADAMFQHTHGLVSGPGSTLNLIANMLGGPERGTGRMPQVKRYLPPQLKMVFEFQDPEEDRAEAEVSGMRAEAREKDINDGVITVRIAREKMVETGELTSTQFAEMELKEGRLPNGDDVLTLFQSSDGQIQGLLAIDAEGDPLDVDINDVTLWITAINKQIRLAQAIAIGGVTLGIRDKAKQAIAAMEKLRSLYEGDEQSPEPSEVEEEEEPDEDTEIDEEEEEKQFPFEFKGGESSFEAGLRSAVRGLWNGSLGRSEFINTFSNVITRRLTQAWLEGAKQCGILPDELTPQEIVARQRLINDQIGYVDSYADDIDEGSKANGGKLGNVMGRVSIWASQYRVSRTHGNGMACSDIKKQWVLDPAKENCDSCLKLNGKVKRNSFWIERSILPQVNGAGYLECRGYRCGCELKDTNAPVSKGPLPSLP